jgi:hypothetical protein
MGRGGDKERGETEIEKIGRGEIEKQHGLERARQHGK